MLGLSSTSVGKQSFVVDVTCATIAGVAVALRLFCKVRYKKGLESDDSWILMALAWFYMAISRVTYGSVSGIGTIDDSVIQELYHTGKDLETILAHTTNEIADLWLPYLKSVFFALYFIAFAEYACKMSILFYCRNIFFIARSYRKASLALMVISTIWVLASVLTTVMLCQPISAFWTNHHPQIPDPGECSHPWGISFLMVHGVGILIDIAILLLPIRTVFTLQMAKKTKYAVAGIFALGGIVVITNIARLTIEQGAFNGLGNSWFRTEVWTSIHLLTAIVCASLPIYKLLGAPISTATASLRTRWMRCRRSVCRLESDSGRRNTTEPVPPPRNDRDRDLELGPVRTNTDGARDDSLDMKAIERLESRVGW